MEIIDVGESWHPTTKQQDQGTRIVLSNVGKRKNVEIRLLMSKLRKVYDQKKDMKDLLKNLSRSCNNPVVMQKEEMKIGRLKRSENKVKNL